MDAKRKRPDERKTDRDERKLREKSSPDVASLSINR